MTENEDLISRSTLLDSFRKCYSGHMGMENSDNTMMFKSICRIINDQEAIGTIEEFKALKEKSVAKKPLFSTVHGDSAYHCSSCKKFVGFYDTRIYEYCHNCGQKMDFGKEE